ncbi:gap junction gamma-1 protein-like [Anabas testudineus]|uniref:Gap junction protein n=1 Tax=Anabas testudineus TaxID=64144 RepID=A0AAQ6IHR4_ANATE|nr:gap junction gamma-1 protein-like [Anabas testudineus]
MSWSFLTSLLDEIHNHSTFVGKIWLIVLIVFRIVLTAVGGESIYNDEQSNFVCNTIQPGCGNICYNAFAPLSHVRFWVFQIILVATPSLIYLGYAVNKIAQAEEKADSGSVSGLSKRRPKKCLASRKRRRGIEETEDDEEEDPITYDMAEKDSDGGGTPKGSSDTGQAKVKVRHDGRQRIKDDGLIRIYVFQLLARSCVEGAFLFGQYALYGFSVPEKYLCSGLPCPNTVDCFVSRATEKTIFLIIMYAVSLLSLALSIWEMLHLGIGSICDIVRTRRAQLPKNKIYGLTQRKKCLDEAAIRRHYDNSYNFSSNAPSTPPGYKIAIKPVVFSTGYQDKPLPINNLTSPQTVCQQNSRAKMGEAHRDVGMVTHQPQKKLEADSHIYSVPYHEHKQRQAPIHTSSKYGQRQQQMPVLKGPGWV